MVRESVDGDQDGFYRYLENYYPDALPASLNDNDGRRGFHAEPPPHILNLLQLREESIPDWWESEYVNNVRDTKAVVVFDLRDANEKW